jgi:integrase
MTPNISLTKRVRRRTLTQGRFVEQTRYVLNWNDPRTGARRQKFFERQKDAQDARTELTLLYQDGRVSKRENLTVAHTIESWLAGKKTAVRNNTFNAYVFLARYITGPIAVSKVREASIKSGKGKVSTSEHLPLLGLIKVQNLSTRQIREWHRLISDEVSVYSANKAIMILKAALALAAEDYEFRPPAMPTGLQRRTDKKRKEVLTPDQVRVLIAAAKEDLKYGVYYAAPFLMGTRPSEQLGLLWDCVDFDNNVIRIERSQLKDGSLSEMTKTEAGRREIPMSPMLREMLLEWRLRCPRHNGELVRVFPAPGARRAWPETQTAGGRPLIYNNFRKRVWVPALKKTGLPAVTPHSARHAFISTLQAQGVEVGLVAKLAGHKSAVVTLSHYTHAMRGGEDAVATLDQCFKVS